MAAAEMLRLPESDVTIAIAHDLAVAAGPHSTLLSPSSLAVVTLAEVRSTADGHSRQSAGAALVLSLKLLLKLLQL